MTCCCTNSSFDFEYLREFEIEFKNILGYEDGVQIGSINGKIQRLKLSHYCSFKVNTVEKSTSIFTDLYEFRGVCSTDIRLDTSTNGLKQVSTSPQAIY
jgi:hypothetical protein